MKLFFLAKMNNQYWKVLLTVHDLDMILDPAYSAYQSLPLNLRLHLEKNVCSRIQPEILAKSSCYVNIACLYQIIAYLGLIDMRSERIKLCKKVYQNKQK